MALSSRAHDIEMGVVGPGMLSIPKESLYFSANKIWFSAHAFLRVQQSIHYLMNMFVLCRYVFTMWPKSKHFGLKKYRLEE